MRDLLFLLLIFFFIFFLLLFLGMFRIHLHPFACDRIQMIKDLSKVRMLCVTCTSYFCIEIRNLTAF